MKWRGCSSAQALRSVLDDLEAAVIEAPDAEVIEDARGCWLSGAAAAQVRLVLQQAARAQAAPKLPRSTTAWPVASRRWTERFEQD